MTDATQRTLFRWTATPVRLTAAALVGLAAYALSFPLETELRILLAYDLAMSTYLARLAVRMAHADAAATRELVENKETSNATVLTVAAVLSGCSLAGVGFMLHRSQTA